MPLPLDRHPASQLRKQPSLALDDLRAQAPCLNPRQVMPGVRAIAIYSVWSDTPIYRCLMAAKTFSAVIGSDLTRAPMASSTALAMAAAVGMIAVSPMLILLYGPLPVSDWKIAVFRRGISLMLGIL